MKVLAWLCPFLYLATTTGSILNGLGKTSAVFLQNTAALSLRLTFVFFGIPRFGIHGCLWGMLASELFLSAMGYVSETNPLFTDFCGNLPLRPAICFLVSQISGLFHSPNPDFPASFLLYLLAGPVSFFQGKDRHT